MADPTTQAPLLSMRGIRKQFPGVLALDNVDFTVRAGEVHALMGENGAGKSTLIKVLTGVYPRDGGEALLNGVAFAPRTPGEAQDGGVSTVYQEVNLIPTLSVAENIFLGRQPGGKGRIGWRAIQRGAEAALARLNLSIDVNRTLATYSIAIRQMVAIARALDIQAKLLILDEPTSSLDADETAQLFAVMRKLKAEGLGILFVTHFLDQVFEVTDRITVLRNGRLVGEYETASLSKLDLVARMLGKDVKDLQDAPRAVCAGDAAKSTFLKATGLGRRGAIEPFDLEIAAGEVMGLAGLLGSGRTEAARLVFGADRADTGHIEVDGRRAAITSPRRAMDCGMGFCPEDRKTEAIIPDLTVRENIILALQAGRGWLRRLSRKKQDELAEHYIRALNIATPGPEQAVKNLSGGNQQKAILARWLASHPKLLILDEPTRGIDVGSRAEIERLILKLCDDGMAILLISSELEEVSRLSHRVAVLRDRRKVAELSGDEVSEGRIMQAIGGAA